MDGDNHFIEDENQICTKVGYLYRVWKIQEADEAAGKKEKKICIRCEVHTHTGRDTESGEGKETMNIYAFNEYDPKITNWKARIDTSLIPCMTEEIKNNSFKVSRWLCQSMLAGVDKMKFAFVTRKSADDSKKHVVLTTHTVNTKVWAQEMAVSMEHMWNKIKYLADTIEADNQEEAAYILLKDFNKMCLRLYRKNEEEGEEAEEEIEEHE